MYERKNLPRLVFCLHALALYLAKMGMAPPMRKMDQGTVHYLERSLTIHTKKAISILQPATSAPARWTPCARRWTT